ncbi:MAG: histidine kinase [Peptococcaceae bacterium BICA1-7]|nr:MAG: histidine kinase [Peptococcaceae bacterium BICA1-7]
MFMVTVIAGLLIPVLGLPNVAMILLLPILFSAAKWGTGPAVTSAALGVLTFDFFFVHPAFKFAIPDIRYLISFTIFLLVAFFTGNLSTRVQQQVISAGRREARMSALYSLSRDIAAVPELDRVAESIVNKVAEIAEGKVVLLLPDNKGKLVMVASSAPKEDSFIIDSESLVAEWVFDRGKRAGRGTDTLGTSEGLYLPLITDDCVQGVLGVHSSSPEIYFQPEQLRLLEAFSSLAAMAVTRARLAEQAKSSEMLAQSERLRTALFSSLSHDFRTPLSSIIGAVTGLLESDDVYTPKVRQELLTNIQMGALRMDRFVSNLLDMARLESGVLQLKKEWSDIQEIIGIALGRMEYSLANRPLKIDIQQDLPLIKADIILIEQVLVNLIDNALKYSVPGTEILISALSKGAEVTISVADQGQNIPHGDMEKIFDKFCRLRSPRLVSGTGLGLAICKGFIEAHKGKIWAENNPAGGTVITFTLPMEDENPNKVIGGEGDVYEE